MGKLSISTLAVAAFFAASPALSADLGNQGDTTSANYVSGKPAFQGGGVGVDLGGQFTNIDVADQFDGVGADGIAGGGHAEYLFALGAFRIGPEIWGGLSNVNVDLGGTDILNQDYYYGGGVKAGYVTGATLIYAHGGYEWSKWTFADDYDVDVGSILVGGGIEHMVASNVSLGLEANYIVPVDVDVEGEDITQWVDKSESLRVLGRVTWRQ